MKDQVRELSPKEVEGILDRGGTILGTSRSDPYVHGRGLETMQPTLRKHRIDRLIVIGGDGTFRSATRLEQEGLPIVGIPKTIDNDIGGTDVSFGFDTAVQIVSDAIDRLATTAESHNRIMVIEVMGRTAGWIAGYGGMAGGAEAILVPEASYDLEDLAKRLRRRHHDGMNHSMVVVAEGVSPPPSMTIETRVDAFGFTRVGGVAQLIGPELERLTGYETRVTILGHLQRGGTPTAFDRILATRMGLAAAEQALDGASGVMIALQGREIVPVDLASSCAEPRLLPTDFLQEARHFFA